MFDDAFIRHSYNNDTSCKNCAYFPEYTYDNQCRLLSTETAPWNYCSYFKKQNQQSSVDGSQDSVIFLFLCIKFFLFICCKIINLLLIPFKKRVSQDLIDCIQDLKDILVAGCILAVFLYILYILLGSVILIFWKLLTS